MKLVRYVNKNQKKWSLRGMCFSLNGTRKGLPLARGRGVVQFLRLLRIHNRGIAVC